MQYRIPAALAAVLLAGPGLSGCGAAPGGASSPVAAAPASQVELPEVVARVNGTAIRRDEFERAVRSAEVRAGQVVPASLRAAVYDRVLDRLIVFHLLLQESETRQLVIDDAEVRAEIGRIREGFPSEEAFEAQLVEWGTSLEELQAERRRDLRIAKLIDADVSPRIAVGDEAVRAFYDQHPDQFAETEAVRASHILDRGRLRRRPRRARHGPGAGGSDPQGRRRPPGPTSPPSRESTPMTARRRPRAAIWASLLGDRPSLRSRRPCSRSSRARSAR